MQQGFKMENIYEKLDGKIYRYIEKEINNNDRILDIGCGGCDLDFYLAGKKENIKITGIDIAGIPKKNRKIKTSSVRCLKKDASFFKPDEKFDVVISKYSLHELKFLDKVLKNSYKHLKKNGKIVIVDFVKNSLAEKLWGEKYFGLEEMETILRKAGFKKIKKKLTTKEGPAFIIASKW